VGDPRRQFGAAARATCLATIVLVLVAVIAQTTVASSARGPVSPLGPYHGGCGAPTSGCPTTKSDSSSGVGPSSTAAEARNWSSVEIAFLLETTPYDGAFDPSSPSFGYGYDPCPLGGSPRPCEESNGVPFFAHHAGEIAAGIAAAHPGTNISFGLVDFFATWDGFDDSDSWIAHSEVANFTDAAAFGTAVNASLGTNLDSNGSLPDSDMNDSLLQSSSITALYGTLSGGLVHWSASAHHVVVLIGSTAPRDPNYLENYSVSAATYANDTNSTLYGGSTCEPSYNGGSWLSPNCEGWITAQDGNASHTVAALARHGTTCTSSPGGSCTLDTIDLWTTSSDPNSSGWPAQFAYRGGGPGGALVTANVNRVLQAGCDIAYSTGGSWDGPSFSRCGVETGTLNFTGVNASFRDSGRLFGAFLNVSLGVPPVPETYPVMIAETGLPEGTNWTLDFNGSLQAGTGPTRTIQVPNGTYSFFGLATTVGGAVYSPSIPVATLAVYGSAANGTVAYLLSGYEVQFNETGLPADARWSIQVGGHGFGGAGNATFVLSNGSYTFATSPPPGYTALPASGVLMVNGGPVWQPIDFLTNASLQPPALVANFTYQTDSEGCLPNGSVTNDVTLFAASSGGTPPYSDHWVLPTSEATGVEVNTTLTYGGNTTVSLNVSDSAGRSAVHTALVSIVLPPCPPPAPGGSSNATSIPFPWVNVGATVVLGAAGLGVAWVVVRRRRGPQADGPTT
jgi:hypothetical protein